MFQFHDIWGDGMSPRIHPKSMDTLLEQHQAEILEDLNSLGRYSRLDIFYAFKKKLGSSYLLAIG